jgi:hypothetical protein
MDLLFSGYATSARIAIEMRRIDSVLFVRVLACWTERVKHQNWVRSARFRGPDWALLGGSGSLTDSAGGEMTITMAVFSLSIALISQAGRERTSDAIVLCWLWVDFPVMGQTALGDSFSLRLLLAPLTFLSPGPRLADTPLGNEGMKRLKRT